MNTQINTEDTSNLSIIQDMSLLGEKYLSGKISDDEFNDKLRNYVSEDIVFWSNYTPSDDRLKPLFVTRNGISEIIDRYKYEVEHEKIKEGTSAPYDLSAAGDIIYTSTKETASFFDGAFVTWDMLTKIKIQDGKIQRIDMYIDSRPIEEVYGQ